MSLQSMVHQILVEENPYSHCTDILDRSITYEDAATNITFDIQEDPSLNIDTVVRYWLNNEFGREVYEEAAKRIVTRIHFMVHQDDLKIGF